MNFSQPHTVPQNVTGEQRQVVCFTVGAVLFGFDIQAVQEILRHQELRKVPLAPPEIAGLLNLRGQIITAIDMRRRLQMPEREPGQLPMHVIIRADGEVVSLLVDAICDVVTIGSEAFEETPATLESLYRSIVSGVYKMRGDLLLLLNTHKVIDLGSEMKV